MSEILMVGEEGAKVLMQTIAGLQCDVETYKSAYDALVYAVNLVRRKRLLFSQINATTAYSFACDTLEDGMTKGNKIIADRLANVIDDDVDYCDVCEEALTAESARAGRCLTCNP